MQPPSNGHHTPHVIKTTMNKHRRRRAAERPPRYSSSALATFLNSLVLLILLFVAQQARAQQDVEPSDNYYCGKTWPDAAQNCHRHCPSGAHSECQGLAKQGEEEEWRCFQFTGCYEPDEDEEIEDEDAGNLVPNNQYCGTEWIDAMVTCNRPCPTGSGCVEGETCYAATNCDKPLVKLTTDLVVTMAGPETYMEDEDTDIFTQTMYETLSADLERNNLNTDGVDLTGQNLIGRRALEYRYHDRSLRGWHGQNIMISNVTQRMLPIGSSALDATLVVTGTYRPPPFHDLDLIAEDSINRQGEKVVSTLRERGERAGREFFSRVQGIEAVSAADITKRPTQSPTGKPTQSPTGLPTPTPSMNPTSDPSSEPSSIPSRSLDQTIMTGSREDLQLGGKTTSSYGFVFNVRTNDDSPTIVITGLDFYTEQTEDVNYEVWSKLGTFQGFKGKLDEWDLISKGVVKGKGIGRYTPIPEESFTSISIPGGGGEEGTRAIYITLDEKSLVYKIGTGVYADEVIQVATPDIQVWEGESVLSYPFPNAEEYPMFYRFPREFLGALHIDRLPCNPFSLYGPVYHDLPCPKVPTAR